MSIKKYYDKVKNLPLPVKASVAFLICNFLQRGISTLTTPIFTRLLSTEQYGYYSIFVSWLDIVSVFATLKLSGGVFTQAVVKFDDECEKMTSSVAGLGTSLTLLLCLLYFPLRRFVNPLMGLNTFTMLCVFSGVWACFVFELWATRQRIDYRYKPLVAMTIFTSIAKPVISIIAIILTENYKAEARIGTIVGVEIVSYIGLFVMFQIKGKSFYDAFYWKYFLSLNIPLIPHYLSRTILNQCDRLMIEKMTGFSNAGIYSLAYSLAWMLNLLTSSILNVFNPWMYKRIKDNERNKIGPVSYMLLLLIAVCILCFNSVAPEIVRIFAPPQYYEAIWIIPPVAASVYFLFMYSLFANFEFYFEKSKYMTMVSTFGGVANVILNYIFIRKYGYIAAGYTTLLCYAVFAWSHYLVMKVILRDSLDNEKVYDVKTIVCISAIFLALNFVLTSMYGNILVRYGFLSVLFIVMIANRAKVISLISEMKKEK